MANGAAQGGGVIGGSQQPASGQDPIKVMMEIAKDPDLAAADKTQLIEFARNRFRHRRLIAYTALWALLVSLGVLLGMAIAGGEGLDQIKDSSLLISIEAFLTAIVGAYYGVSAWRPAS